jgi:hypothetical protein
MPSDPYVPLIVIGLIVIIVFLAGRPKTGTVAESADEPPSGAELIEHLQRTLGIAVVVESVESVESAESVDPSSAPDAVTIQATLLAGAHSTKVTVAGPTESDAWAALARAAIAWRNSDFQHIPMWWGSG